MGSGADKDRRDKDRDRREKKDNKDRGHDRDRGRSRHRRRRRDQGDEAALVGAVLKPAPAVAATPAPVPPEEFEEITEEEEQTDDETEESATTPEVRPGKEASAKAPDTGDRAKDKDRRSRSRDRDRRRHGKTDEEHPRPKDTRSQEHKASKDQRPDHRHEKPAKGNPPKPPPNQSHTQDTDDKSASYGCTICGRNVGGGAAGDWQHRQSPFHLSHCVWNNDKSGQKTWQQCQSEGKQWSKQLHDKQRVGPSGRPGKVDDKTESSPPPVRADPERKRRDFDKGPGPSGSGGGGTSSSSSTLVQLWQATVRELSR